MQSDLPNYTSSELQAIEARVQVGGGRSFATNDFFVGCHEA